MLKAVVLPVCYQDFLLSRKAKLVTPQTLLFYKKTLGKFASSTSEVSLSTIRLYLAGLVDRGCQPSYIASHARAIKSFVRFLYSEGYIDKPITVSVPRIPEKQLLCPSQEQVRKVIASCTNLRDKLIVMVLFDTGIRASELLSLKWEDIDFDTGLTRISKAKGGKFRYVVVGITTRRQLLRYRQIHQDSPVFSLTYMGLRSLFLRLSNRSGIKCTPHSLRRSFATISSSRVNLFTLAKLMGHTSLEMTQRYCQISEHELMSVPTPLDFQ